MPYPTFEQDKAYLTAKFRHPEFDPATGLDNEAVKRGVMLLAQELEGEPRPVVKARAFEYVTRNVRIDVSPHDWFVGFGCWNRDDRPLTELINSWSREQDRRSPELTELRNLCNRTGATAIWKDFDHSVPDWDAICTLGFPGLLGRAREYRWKHEADGTLAPRAAAYFDGIEITYGAIIEMLGRFRAYALERASGSERISAVAECLDTLIHGAPRNTFEVLSLIYLYFMFGEHIDRYQVRSLGNLDRMLWPYVRRDLAEGRFTEPQIRELIGYFFMQWASIDNYWGHPFYLGGTKADGTTEVNEMTRMILEEYDRLGLHTPKIQIKVAPNTPPELLDRAFDMIRRGHSSIVFVCEPGIAHSMTANGFTAEEARTCDIRGCYEFVPRALGNATGVGHLNMLKPIELVLNDGADPLTGLEYGVKTGNPDALQSFDEFLAAYFRQLDGIIGDNIRCADDFERGLQEINPSQVFSATIRNSLETARDAFADGSVYNISTILEAGFGSAVDALEVIREYVYERKELTLSALRDILKADWRGQEKLRRRILHGRNRYGNGIERVDRLAELLARHVSERINGRPNARGGVYQASGHSARQFICLGEKTGATPDGRRAGDEMSKNLSPVQGADTNGVTALVKSLATIDSACYPGDYPLDVMMHPATVKGAEGLGAMRALLATYMQRNGVAIHFNIFDAETLTDAQAHPENYRGLQVRVCGWNVLFNDICRKEQDAYIERARAICE
ncbi:MAG: hypothetical protein HPZ91_08525 [Lentisphaeria bacterium]|nr:hypothetical protein [Lentisphaeria bacterium]